MKQSSDPITHLTQSSLLSPQYFVTDLIRNILSKGADCRFRAKGHSMSPFIKEGDVVTVSPLTDSSPGMGDVIAFIHPKREKLIIHRVVWKSRDSYLAKGENAFETDGFVKKADILGLVTKVERDGKKVAVGLGPERFFIAFLTHNGFFLSFILPIWRLIPSIIRKSVRLFF